MAGRDRPEGKPQRRRMRELAAQFAAEQQIVFLLLAVSALVLRVASL
jgi:hypothetical protein